MALLSPLAAYANHEGSCQDKFPGATDPCAAAALDSSGRNCYWAKTPRLVRMDANSCAGGDFMRNILALIGLAVVTLVGAGWYLDWFTVHKGASDDGNKNYNVEVNTNKI